MKGPFKTVDSAILLDDDNKKTTFNVIFQSKHDRREHLCSNVVT